MNLGEETVKAIAHRVNPTWRTVKAIGRRINLVCGTAKAKSSRANPVEPQIKVSGRLFWASAQTLKAVT
jgi:hypothetical protein